MKANFKRFAQMFVRTRNTAEAAVRSGCDPADAKSEGERLFNDSRVKEEIRRLDKNDEQTLCYVKTGLSRIAFGSVNDAVALMFAEGVTKEDILQADLFNLSEIKFDKGKIEMKFFDRQKALEKLVELDPQLKEVSDAESFIKAVYSGSRQLDEQEDTADD